MSIFTSTPPSSSPVGGFGHFGLSPPEQCKMKPSVLAERSKHMITSVSKNDKCQDFRSSPSAFGRYPETYGLPYALLESSLAVSNKTNSTVLAVGEGSKSTNPSPTNDSCKCEDFRRSDVMAKLLISGFMSDCKFVVGPDNETAETIPGHKLLFALVSPVFEEMFNGGFKEAQNNSEIRITDAEPRDFKNFRYIIYNNDANLLSTLSVEDIIQIYILSDKYMITSIAALCLQTLTQSLPKMSIDDIILIFQFALGLDDKILLQTVKNKIKCTDAKNNKKLNDLNESEFYEYILILREVNKTLEMFSAIETYFENHNFLHTQEERDTKSENKKEEKEKDVVSSSETHKDSNQDDKLLKKCLKCIDFGNVSIDDFKKGPGESKILSFEQKYFILSRLGSIKSIIIN